MTVLTSKKSPEIFLSCLKNVLLLPDNPHLDSRVAFHTDLSVFSFGDAVICDPSLYGFLEKSLPDARVVSGESAFSPYPNDVLYNAALVGNTLFCNVRHTSPTVLAEAERRGIKIADVKQGYAKCSTVIVSDSAVITSDVSIKNAAEKVGKDVLFVSNRGVVLNGFSNGFIGGASLRAEDSVIFTGDIYSSPEAEKIIAFIESHEKKAVFFRDFPLTDIGSPATVG